MEVADNFVELFLRENEALNLSAARTPERVQALVADSLMLSHYLPLEAGMQVLDVGSGGGFPGLVLAQVFPDVSFSLLDAVQKKCSAVKRLSDQLNLSTVQVVCGRAETRARDEDLREQFDVVVAKAVAALPTLLELTVPFVKQDGVFVAYKGPSYEEELIQSKAAQEVLGVELSEVQSYTLEGEEESRALLFFRRTGPLSDLYPRRDGLPKKSPLM